MHVVLIRIWFKLMPHNDNYLRNILRQQLRDYRTVEKGSGEAALTLPKKYNAMEVRLFTSHKDAVHNLM